MPEIRPPAADQRRHHPRIDLRMSAEVRTSQTVFTATTRDLSEGGAGLTADRPFGEGEEVVVGLFLVVDDVESDTPPLWVKARVAWTSEVQDNRYTAGVRFEVITDDQRVWLRHVLKEIAKPQTKS
ncbi:MAG TPA: PilZ domain-containing protein [Polyangia bacterium]|jgi:Tfp pilus assembly protein PilZ|nr:PilZ domain-containing protein [Polyangia bacterium]